MGTQKSEMNRHTDAKKNGLHALLEAQVNSNFEANYVSNSDLSHRRSLGQFFTPPAIANAMAEWIIQIQPKDVLDPAVGTGILLRAVSHLSKAPILTGWDIDSAPLQYAKQSLESIEGVELKHADFLRSEFAQKFDAIVANPPYVRHHLIDYQSDIYENFSLEIGKIPKTSNLYVLFVGAIIKSLKPNGRASILLPSDWLNSNFGVALKIALQRLGITRRIAYFCNDTLPFADNLSTAVILFLENSLSDQLTEIVVIDSELESELISKLGSKDLPDEFSDYRKFIKLGDIDPKKKWGSILEGSESDAPDGWISLEEIAKTKRGIATGANDYFLINVTQLSDFGLNKNRARRCVGRAKDVRGLIFSGDDFEELEGAGAPSRLMDLDPAFPEDAKYIELGVERDLPSRFLLANRKQWFLQEAREPAPIWVGVFGREGIRFIWNKALVSNLTTFHCLYPDLEMRECGALVALLNSSSLQAWNKRSERSYGGGLQKVEPRDILQMYLPNINRLTTGMIDQLLASLGDADELHRTGSDYWRYPLDQVALLASTMVGISK